tara:strand:- start:2396 stop:3079 length:684 start_codon:yes stop_codon:yes gene_type:complete
MIPKRIIQIYENHNLPMIYKIGQEIIKEKHSDYEYIFYTKRLMTKFVEIHYPQYIDLYNSLLDCNKNTLFILLELYKNGGIYLDNEVILHKKMDELLENNCCIMPLSNNKMIDNYCICTNKDNKFIFYIIFQISIRHNTNSNFITNKNMYDFYTRYKNNNRNDIKVIYGEYNNCFGNFLYNIKINSDPKQYPDWFKNNIYEIATKNKVKNTLKNDIKWLDNVKYNFL